MTKTLKIVFGLTLALALVIGGASVASAEGMGDSGAGVSMIQSDLISLGYSIPAGATGYYGAQTQAAVSAFQAAYASEVLAPLGLTAPTGFAGTLTKAKIAALKAGGPVVSGLPAGCTSTSGYSTTTGQPCSGATSTVPGCTSTVGFSPTTGQPCSGSTTTTTSTTLTGGAGSVSEYDLLSSPTDNREVGEDQNDVKVLGISIEADEGSDLMLTAVKLNFAQAGATPANRDLEKYASDVSVWLGSTEVARVDAADFTDDNNFDKTLSLKSGAIIKAGAVGNLYVALSGVSNLDSADDAETWTLDVESVRFVDAQGATVSEDPGTAVRTFTAELFATAADVELKLTESSSNPDSQVIEASDTDSTDGVLLFKGSLKAMGSDIDLKEMDFTVTPAGTGDASEIASQYILKINGDEIQALNSNACTVAGDCDGTGTATAVVYNFDDVDVDITSGSTVTVELVADVNELDGVIVAEGDSLQADVNNDDTVAQDEAGEDLAAADLTGAVTGEAQSFYSEAFSFVKKSASGSITAPADQVATGGDVATYAIKFELTAFGGDISIDRSCVEDGTQAADEGISYIITNPGNHTSTCSFASTADDNADDTGASWLLRDGETEEFTLTVAVEASADTFAKIYLESVNWDDDQTDVTPDQTFNAGLGETKTSTNELYLNFY